MSILTDHPINGLIANVLALAEDERLPKLEGALTLDMRAGLGRIFNFGRLIRDLLSKSSAEEVSLNGLNALNSNLQQSYSELSAFVSSGNQANLGNALANLDNAAAVFSWTFYDRPVRGAKPQFESVESVRRAAEKAIASTEKRAVDFDNAITATAARLQAQDQRISELTGVMDEVRSTSSAAVAAIQQQFNENLSTYRSEIDDLKLKFRSSQQEFSAESTHDAEELIKELEAQRDKAAQIVQIVGNIGVTGNYQNRASQESAQANFWRWITLALFLTGVILVTVNLILNFRGSIDLTALIARFAIAVTIALPALYTARESARHRTNADRAKQTELELASLGPFLETLPVDQREQIIGELSKSYFGRDVEPHEVSAPLTAEQLQKTLTATADLVGKVKSVSP